MLRLLLPFAAAGTVVHALPALAPVASPVAGALGVPRRIARDDAIALTFDDGPHPEGTPAVLEILRDAGAHATFFLVGEQVQRNPALAREIVTAGHAVALHGHRHRNLLRLTPAEVADDLAHGHDAIADATGVAPRLHRAPYGVYSAAALTVARRRWQPLLWSRWGRDWRKHITPEQIAALVTRELRGGDVLLLHDADDYSAPGSWRRTVLALPRVIETARSLKLSFAVVEAGDDRTLNTGAARA